MIFGETSNPTLAGVDLAHPIWKRCWTWIENWTSDRPLGIEIFESDQFFANLHEYATKDLADCKWESHKHTIDLQVVLNGGEHVDFLPETPLVPVGDYDPDKERWIYEPVSSSSRIHIKAGRFAIFWPGEPHRPQIKAPGSDGVVKVVFKINRSLVD